jgi:spermidine synthase
MVHFLHRHLPHVRLDVVEREQLIIDLARRYFLLPAADTLHLFQQDALAFLETPDTCGYQVALVDIFTPGAMAAPVFEPAFHRALLDRLDADGVLAVNLWSGDRPSFDRALAALEEASGGQFLQMQVSRRSNVIVLAFPVAIPRAAIKRVRKNGPLHQRRYQLDFPRYLKRLRRSNRLPLLARLLG